jgi:hypothetical protein
VVDELVERQKARASPSGQLLNPALPPVTLRWLHESGATLDLLKDLGPVPENTCVHLDAGYDSGVTRILLADRGLQGAFAHKGLAAPVQATKRWPVERTPGTTTSTNWRDAPNVDGSSPTSTSPLPTPSSWSADFYAAPGPSTAGTRDPAAGPDLLAHSLSQHAPLSGALRASNLTKTFKTCSCFRQGLVKSAS